MLLLRSLHSPVKISEKRLPERASGKSKAPLLRPNLKTTEIDLLAIRTELVTTEFSANSVREPRYKRPFDLATLVIAHLLLAPLWLVLWIAIPLAIKLDDGGPVFYSQRRIGRGGKEFTVRKFRSMVIDAEKGTGAVWASRNDPRITRIGKILRHTALDELPQVLNVWAGDMSLVGPRPERPQLHVQITSQTPEFDKRLNVRPGMAGMAQVYGKYDLAPPAKLVYDLRYAESMSIFLDIKLLTMAVFNTVLGRWGHATGDAAAPASESSTALPSNIVQFSPVTDTSGATVNTDDQDEDVDIAA